MLNRGRHRTSYICMISVNVPGNCFFSVPGSYHATAGTAAALVLQAGFGPPAPIVLNAQQQ